MRLVLALTFTLASIGPLTVQAQGDPYADVGAMRSAFAHITSARAIQTFSSGEVATVTFVAPDLYQTVLPKSQVVFAGDVEYSKQPGTSWSKLPNAAANRVMVEHLWQFAGDPALDIRRQFKVTAVGTKTAGGTMLRGYRLLSIPDGRLTTVWVGSNGLPVDVQIDLGGGRSVSVHYTDYNAPIYIATP